MDQFDEYNKIKADKLWELDKCKKGDRHVKLISYPVFDMHHILF